MTGRLLWIVGLRLGGVVPHYNHVVLSLTNGELPCSRVIGESAPRQRHPHPLLERQGRGRDDLNVVARGQVDDFVLDHPLRGVCPVAILVVVNENVDVQKPLERGVCDTDLYGRGAQKTIVVVRVDLARIAFHAHRWAKPRSGHVLVTSSVVGKQGRVGWIGGVSKVPRRDTHDGDRCEGVAGELLLSA